MRDRFNLHLTNKNHNRNNRSVLALGYCTIFTPQCRSKKKSLISMLGGQEERDTTAYKIGDGFIDDGNKFFCLGLNVTSMPSKGFYLCDKEVAQEQPGVWCTDEEWEDLEGPERWNFLKYCRSDFPFELGGIHVKLSYEMKNKKILHCTKKSLQEVINWLTYKYTKDAPVIYKRYGGSRFGPIFLKELRNIKQDAPVTDVEKRSAFFPPDQVKFTYRSCF